MNMSSWWKKGIGIVAIVAIAGGVIGGAVMLLWNWLVPPVFGLETITFWQALGLFVLGRILFGGLRGFGHRHRHHRHRFHDRWSRMTPQERETFSRGLRNNCRWGRHASHRGDADSSQTSSA